MKKLVTLKGEPLWDFLEEGEDVAVIVMKTNENINMKTNTNINTKNVNQLAFVHVHANTKNQNQSAYHFVASKKEKNAYAHLAFAAIHTQSHILKIATTMKNFSVVCQIAKHRKPLTKRVVFSCPILQYFAMSCPWLFF